MVRLDEPFEPEEATRATQTIRCCAALPITGERDHAVLDVEDALDRIALDVDARPGGSLPRRHRTRGTVPDTGSGANRTDDARGVSHALTLASQMSRVLTRQTVDDTCHPRTNVRPT